MQNPELSRAIDGMIPRLQEVAQILTILSQNMHSHPRSLLMMCSDEEWCCNADVHPFIYDKSMSLAQFKESLDKFLTCIPDGSLELCGWVFPDMNSIFTLIGDNTIDPFDYTNLCQWQHIVDILLILKAKMKTDRFDLIDPSLINNPRFTHICPLLQNATGLTLTPSPSTSYFCTSEPSNQVVDDFFTTEEGMHSITSLTDAVPFVPGPTRMAAGFVSLGVSAKNKKLNHADFSIVVASVAMSMVPGSVVASKISKAVVKNIASHAVKGLASNTYAYNTMVVVESITNNDQITNTNRAELFEEIAKGVGHVSSNDAFGSLQGRIILYEHGNGCGQKFFDGVDGSQTNKASCYTNNDVGSICIGPMTRVILYDANKYKTYDNRSNTPMMVDIDDPVGSYRIFAL